MNSVEVIQNREIIGESSFKKKILIETRIWCKNDQINEDVVIIENLPEGIVVKGFKVKERRGRSNIEKVSYEEKTIDGEVCHVITVKPKKAAFKKKTKVWVILDVLITPKKKHLIINQK